MVNEDIITKDGRTFRVTTRGTRKGLDIDPQKEPHRVSNCNALFDTQLNFGFVLIIIRIFVLIICRCYLLFIYFWLYSFNYHIDCNVIQLVEHQFRWIPIDDWSNNSNVLIIWNRIFRILFIIHLEFDNLRDYLVVVSPKEENNCCQ